VRFVPIPDSTETGRRQRHEGHEDHKDQEEDDQFCLSSWSVVIVEILLQDHKEMFFFVNFVIFVAFVPSRRPVSVTRTAPRSGVIFARFVPNRRPVSVTPTAPPSGTMITTITKSCSSL
jgi:hypothetical protein